MTPSISSSASDLAGNVAAETDQMVDRFARTAHQAVDRVAGSATGAVERASGAVDRMRTGLQSARGTMGDKMSELSGVRSQWVDNARSSVRDHPLAAVGIGLAIGWLIARVLRSER